MSLISCQQITKEYSVGETTNIILKGLSFTIHPGEMIAIVGPSGSGKSTLMNLIGLLDKSDSGNYFLHGKNVKELNDDQLANLRNEHIGFVFQHFNLLPRFNVMQNVGLPLTYRQPRQSSHQHQIEAVLEKVGMKAFAKYYPTQLSGGQQQRIAIARALVGSPQVLLADEPTGALDSSTGKEIMNLFLSLHAEGKTIILITHDERIAAQCKRIITMADGQIVRDTACG